MMTKVLMNRDLLAYRLYMKDSLQQVLMQNYITGAPQPLVAETVLEQEHLLPPCIGFMALDGYLGQGDDYIAVTAPMISASTPCTSPSWTTGLRDRKRRNMALPV